MKKIISIISLMIIVSTALSVLFLYEKTTPDYEPYNQHDNIVLKDKKNNYTPVNIKGSSGLYKSEVFSEPNAIVQAGIHDLNTFVSLSTTRRLSAHNANTSMYSSIFLGEKKDMNNANSTFSTNVQLLASHSTGIGKRDNQTESYGLNNRLINVSGTITLADVDIAPVGSSVSPGDAGSQGLRELPVNDAIWLFMLFCFLFIIYKSILISKRNDSSRII